MARHPRPGAWSARSAGWLLSLAITHPLHAAPWTEENAPWNVNFNPGTDPGNYFGRYEGHVYFPSPPDWRALPIYQLLTDRFADGDPTNNIQWPWLTADFDPRDMTLRHGGDFRGIMDKLDYIQGLGCRAIWISPLFQNGFNEYHQYAMEDFTLIDRRLGTLEDLRALVQACHLRGIYVLIDVVVNHMANMLQFDGVPLDEGAPYVITNDEYTLSPREGGSSTGPIKPAPTQPYTDFQYNNTWDPHGTYTLTHQYYDKYGNGYWYNGTGTYSYSDFHHNGDLADYEEPFCINVGKIYGIMDDLRCESPRVQRKLIAAAKAMMASTDIDGFRIDTPMQVPLGFFKAWAPEIKRYAAEELGKTNFGLWGEFFVEVGRYATMTGRGKDNTMYGDPTAFIDNVTTLNGGIDYAYYHYMRHVLLRNDIAWNSFPLDPEDRTRYDGPTKLWDQERETLDTWNPQTNRDENTMWHFCNNHDQWRMSAIVDATGQSNGVPVFKSCLGWLTFWTGVPLHYAGDEQSFGTFGTALDGWAREELAVSGAWRAMGTIAPLDHFDMVHPMYLFIQKLNRIRHAYMSPVVSCDNPLNSQVPSGSAVFAFERGCPGEALADTRILVAVNLDRKGGAYDVRLNTSWPAGAIVSETVRGGGLLVADDGTIGLSMPPHSTAVLVHTSNYQAIPPVVIDVSPSQDELVTASAGPFELRLTFDGRVSAAELETMQLDGIDVLPATWCTVAGGCTELVLSVDQPSAGVHTLLLRFADWGPERIGGIFQSRFRMAAAHAHDLISNPHTNRNDELVSKDFQRLVHRAAGASHFRVRRADEPNWKWTQWYEVNMDYPFYWTSTPGIATVVQYWSAGSSAYLAAGCREEDGSPCAHVAVYSQMHMRACACDWAEDAVPMARGVEDFTWQAEVSVGVEPARLWLDVFADTDKKFGSMMDIEVQRAMENATLWEPAGGHVSIASGAPWAQQIRIDACCTLQAQELIPGQPGVWHSLEPCDKQNTTCAFTFNDLTLQITAADAFRPAAPPAPHVPEPFPLPPATPPASSPSPYPPSPSPPRSICGETHVVGLADPVNDPCGTMCTLSLKFQPTDYTDEAISSAAVIADAFSWDYKMLEQSATDARVWQTTLNVPNGAALQYKLVLNLEHYYIDVCADYTVTDLSDNNQTQGFVNSVAHVDCTPASGSAHALACAASTGEATRPRAAAENDDAEDGAIAQLFEWRYDDVASECKRLGAEGWLAVEVSPPVAHLTLGPSTAGEYMYTLDADEPPVYSWIQRWSPTNLLRLDSRSGSATELEEAARTCAAHGVRLYAAVSLNGMAGARCCDRAPELGQSGLPCQDFGFDAPSSVVGADGERASEVCPALLEYPASQLHDASAFHHVCYISRWDDVANVQRCQQRASPDLRTDDPAIRTVVANLLNSLAMRGVSGFRILDAALINAADLGAILGMLQPVGSEIASALGLPAQKAPAIIYDLWPETLMRYPWYQRPADEEDAIKYDLKSDAYVDLRFANAYVTDPGFALVAADAWTCDFVRGNATGHNATAACTMSLADLTQSASFEATSSRAATYPGYVHPRWQLGVQQPPSAISRALNTPFINAFAVRDCGGVGCTQWPSAATDGARGAQLTAVATAWAMALPGGPVSVFSSYDWDRQFVRDAEHPRWFKDRRWWTGPPRASNGATQRVSCAAAGELTADLSPSWSDDGTRWLCEHRHPIVAAMPRWRRVVAGATGVRHVSAADGVVAFGRGVEQRGKARPAAWLLLAKPGALGRVSADFDTGLPAGSYCDQSGGPTAGGADLSGCARVLEVDWHGRLSLNGAALVGDGGGRRLAAGDATAEPAAIILHTAEAALRLQGIDGAGMVLAVVAWLLILLIPAALWCRMWRVATLEVRLQSGVCTYEHNRPGADPVGHLPRPSSTPTPEKAGVLMAGLEHVVPSLKLKISAGGLGNVAALYVERLPCPGKFVFAKVSPINGVPDYSAFTPIEPIVLDDGTIVELSTYTPPDNNNVEFLAMSHPLFLARTKANIYPDGRKPQEFMVFMSLFNRSVAHLLDRYQKTGEVRLFHALDYHAALAPIYLEAAGGTPIPVAMTLHNALYQGSLLETLTARQWHKIERALQLPNARFFCDFEGDFNMLYAATQYIRHHQHGAMGPTGCAITGVSHQYGSQVGAEIPLFKGIAVGGHPNPMMETSRPKLPPADMPGADALMLHKARCKAATQEKLGFDVDPSMVLISFVGRWAYEKGIDLMAEAAIWMLREYDNVQVLIVGPPGDESGQWAASRLVSIAKIPAIAKRLFVKAEFFMVTPEMRFACDFTICPSRTEPFGYVDVEFAWHGCPTIGSMVGGLGKVPGIYFRNLEPGDNMHVLRQLQNAIALAMEMDAATLADLSHSSLEVTFPVDKWSAALDEQYLNALFYEGKTRARVPPSSTPTLVGSLTSTTGAVAVASVSVVDTSRTMETLHEESSCSLEPDSHFAMPAGLKPGAERSQSIGVGSTRSEDDAPLSADDDIDDRQALAGTDQADTAVPTSALTPQSSMPAAPVPPVPPMQRAPSTVTTSNETADWQPTRFGRHPSVAALRAPGGSRLGGVGGSRHPDVHGDDASHTRSVSIGHKTRRRDHQYLDMQIERAFSRNEHRSSLHPFDRLPMFAAANEPLPLTMQSATSRPLERAEMEPVDEESSVKRTVRAAHRRLSAAARTTVSAVKQHAGRLSNSMDAVRTAAVSSLSGSTSPDSQGSPDPTHLSRKISELQPTMNAQMVDEEVARHTVHNFLSATPKPMGQIITDAYDKARIRREDNDRDAVAEGLLKLVPCYSREEKWMGLHDFMRYHVLGCSMMGWIVNLLGIFVPVGSLSILAFALYGTDDWTSSEVMALFSTHSATTAIGAWGWMRLARCMQTTHLLALAPILQCSMIVLLYGGVIPKPAFFAFAAVHGLAAGAVEPLYIGFNYLDKWAGDSRTAAYRMSLVEPWRFLFQYLLVGLLALGSDDLKAQATGVPPVYLQGIFWTITACTFVLGLLALYIPIERTLRLPPVAFTYRLFPSWCWLLGGDMVAKISGFLDVIYLSWMFIAGYSNSDVGVFFFVVGASGALTAFAFCALLFTIHGYGKTITAIVALFTFPPTLLGQCAAFSAQRLPQPGLVPFFLGLAIVLATLKRMASSLLKVYSMPSRWKYVTFQSYAAFLLSLCEAVSPVLMYGLSNLLDLDISVKGDVHSEVFARSSFVLAFIFSVIHFGVSAATVRHLIGEGILLWFPSPHEPPRWPPPPEDELKDEHKSAAEAASTA